MNNTDLITHADHYFAIGSTHEVCNDYALSGASPLPFAILSDGCSSSPDTDVGARLLAQAAQTTLIDQPALDYTSMGKAIAFKAVALAQIMRLPLSALDATLLLAYRIDDEIIVRAYGDGAVLVQQAGKVIAFNRIEYEDNLPYYLSYEVDPIRRAEFVRLTAPYAGQVKRLSRAEPPPADASALHDGVAGQWRVPKIEEHQPFDEPSHWRYRAANGLAVTLFSDGIASFADTHAQRLLSEHDVAQTLGGFKNVNGRFLARRVKRGLRDYAKDGFVPGDDISAASLVSSSMNEV